LRSGGGVEREDAGVAALAASFEMLLASIARLPRFDCSLSFFLFRMHKKLTRRSRLRAVVERGLPGLDSIERGHARA
jgi:hypothetical protein